MLKFTPIGAVDGEFSRHTMLLAVRLLVLAGGKIITTSFTISSGGSGGVFGPSMVIGGALGGAVGLVFYSIPQTRAVCSEPAVFVLLGMAGFFSAVANAPISTLIMVSEMTALTDYFFHRCGFARSVMCWVGVGAYIVSKFVPAPIRPSTGEILSSMC